MDEGVPQTAPGPDTDVRILCKGLPWWRSG